MHDQALMHARHYCTSAYWHRCVAALDVLWITCSLLKDMGNAKDMADKGRSFS